MTAQLVGNLIKEGHDNNDIEYGGFLANHLFHGLIALHHLHGKPLYYFKNSLSFFNYSLNAASPEFIIKWKEYYYQHTVLDHHLEPARKPDNLVITKENYQNFKGNTE